MKSDERPSNSCSMLFSESYSYIEPLPEKIEHEFEGICEYDSEKDVEHEFEVFYSSLKNRHLDLVLDSDTKIK